jgi:hypothetical protein
MITKTTHSKFASCSTFEFFPLEAKKEPQHKWPCGSCDALRLLLLRLLLPGFLVTLLAALSWLLLLLTRLLVLVALLAALVWIAHVISSIELVFDAMAQLLVECIGSILVGTIFWATRQTLLDTR